MYDLIIIGGGPAAFSAGLYASRFGIKNLIMGKILGGTALNAHVIENYPGVLSTEGSELIETFQKQAEKFGSEVKEEEVK
ncbi:MAG: NAD(P)/FAD-dependent oxidoreductase, partial [Candidatus Aenigmatarchaeota archaeon]